MTAPWPAELPNAFAIGLAPLGGHEAWLAPQDGDAAMLRQKAELIATRRDIVFMARPDTADAQAEVAQLVREAAGAPPDAPADGEPPLLAASRLVADDLVIMRKAGDGWRLVAASLCFPTHWSLAAKFDRPMATIHAPVPGFGEGTRNAGLIERMFDNLKPDVIVARTNWSIHRHGELHRPDPHPAHLFASDDDVAALAAIHLRCERQTLRKLAVSGDVLFTIRVMTDPVGLLADAAPDLLAGLAGRLRALSREQCDYKGLQSGRDLLADRLETLARDGNQARE